MNKDVSIPEERILTKIILVRDEKVILDVAPCRVVRRGNQGLETGRQKEFSQVPA